MLVVKSTEGPWGAGSKESVGLVYEDQVVAIVGALDGRNGHLAEQVATKSHLTYLETRATEPTLSQAFVPWFMRCIPNDNQQARALLEQIWHDGGGTVAILSDQQYDNRYAARSFIKIAAMEEHRSPLILMVDSLEVDIKKILHQLQEKQVRHLVLPFFSSFTRELLDSLPEQLPELRVYGTLGFSSRLVPEDPLWLNLEGMVLVSPGYLHSPSGKSFQEHFISMAGHPPHAASAFTYDGVAMVIKAILNAGTDREAIRDELRSMQGTEGVTGPISFDEMGNRSGEIQFIQIKNSVPVLLSKSSW
jgi:ABC-type branched-subunit amino acid transport system substrate-binding protein